jgi:predicted nucleotidyltransferase
MQIEKNAIIDFLNELKPALIKEGICTVGLFGSYAKEHVNVYSDIDIAVQKEKDYLQHHSPYDYFETLNHLRSALMRRFHRNIDIFDLDSTSTLKASIEKELIRV